MKFISIFIENIRRNICQWSKAYKWSLRCTVFFHPEFINIFYFDTFLKIQWAHRQFDTFPEYYPFDTRSLGVMIFTPWWAFLISTIDNNFMLSIYYCEQRCLCSRTEISASSFPECWFSHVSEDGLFLVITVCCHPEPAKDLYLQCQSFFTSSKRQY